MKTIVIYEDSLIANFLPLVYFRPIYDLFTGIDSLRTKISRQFGENIILHSRKYLENYLKSENTNNLVNHFEAENLLFINGRVLFSENDLQILKNVENETIFLSENQIVAAFLSKKNYQKVVENSDLLDFTILNSEVETAFLNSKVINYAWDLFSNNGEQINIDLKYHNYSKYANNYDGVFARNSEQVFLGKNVDIHPNCFLDATHGPIILDDNSTIMSQTTIQGPTYIGKNSTIKIGSKIYHETTIGNSCKVGGEVENSIIHGFANKQHDGFLGHSYISEWCNLGAGTNNSDLKNNYDKISVKMNGKNVDTNLQFVGLIMGDHSKTAIGMQFNTGTICGVSANIFGAGFPSRNIPSFSWGGADLLKSYQLEKAKEVAKIVMNRRKIEFSEVYEQIFNEVYRMSEIERLAIRK